MTDRRYPNRYGAPPEHPEPPANLPDVFSAWAGDFLLPEPTQPGPEAEDAPPALTDVDAAEVLERLYPGRAARQAAEADRAANPARFGEWAAERFTASTDTPEAEHLAAFLNRPRNP